MRIHRSWAAVTTLAAVALAACGDHAAPVGLEHEGRSQAAGERSSAPELAVGGLARRGLEPVEALEPAGPAEPENSAGADAGLPFGLLADGEAPEIRATQANFVLILGGSDDVPPEAARTLWKSGEARPAFEVCMQLAATARFARGYQDREIARYQAGQRSLALADEIAPAGAFLRMNVADRISFERALDEAHRLSKEELWMRVEALDDSAEFSDWCSDLHDVLEDTSTLVYERGIEPYLPD